MDQLKSQKTFHFSSGRVLGRYTNLPHYDSLPWNPVLEARPLDLQLQAPLPPWPPEPQPFQQPPQRRGCSPPAEQPLQRLGDPPLGPQ